MLAIFLGAVSSWLILLVLVPFLRHRVADIPNQRSSHSVPTPRAGGLSFVLVSSLASWLGLLSVHPSPSAFVPLVVVFLATIGLLDDIRGLSPFDRYSAQLVTSGLLLGFSPLVQRAGCCISFVYFILLLFLLLIAVSAVINFTNFMDGLDGLVAGCMLIAIAAFSVKLSASWPLWALVGALLGFLFWNWSPAKVFMGDVGSTFLGAVFAGLVLQASSWPEAFGCLLVATPLLGDACLCVPRRLLAGQRVFQAHRLHLFQRLHQAGWPHARVSLTYILATAVLAVAMLAGGLPWVFGLAVGELLVGVWLDQRVAVPFAVASQS